MSEIDVVLDCVIFDLQPSGGVSRYWVNLIAGLAALPDGPRLHLLVNEQPRTESAVKVMSLARANPRISLHSYTTRMLERIRQPDIPARLRGRAVFHSSYYRSVSGMPNVLTMHDFTYEDLVGGWKARGQHWQKSLATSRSAAVICVSECTRRDFNRRFPAYRQGSTDVILHGVEEHFSPSAQARRGNPSPGDYVLFVGRRVKQKNFWSAVEGIKRLKHLTLVIVGSPLTLDEQLRLDAELAGRYVVRPNANDSELVDLYRSAFALIYPSQYEGFGLPVLEAMACGCPAVALRASSIPEVAGDGAILLNDASPECIEQALESIRATDARAALVDRGLMQAGRFSWARAASEYAAIYKRLDRSAAG